MVKHYNKIASKIGDVIGVICILFFDIITVIFCFACLYVPFNNYHVGAFFYWAFRAYIVFAIVIIILGEIHYFRWFVLDKKQNVNCHNCGEKVVARRKEIWNPDEYPSVDFLYPIHGCQRMIRLQTCRPVLFYTCPVCGTSEYICPYCHKPVNKEDEKCPHCGKRMVRNTHL